MINGIFRKDDIYKLHNDSIIKLIFITGFSYILSLCIWKFLWANNEYLIHSFLELLCIFVGISTFLLSWNTYSYNNWSNKIIGFGLLIVSSFDLLHVHYYEGIYKYTSVPNDLTLKFWMMSRIVQAMILLALGYLPQIHKSAETMGRLNIEESIRAPKGNKEKYVLLIISTIAVMFTWYIFFNYSLFTLYTAKGVTSSKIAIEVLVIIMVGLALVKLHKNSQLNERLKPEYIFMSLGVIIINEISFILVKVPNSFYLILGHVLKIASYYYLYKGIFESTVKYPYDKVEEMNNKLVDILDAIPVALITYSDNKLSFANKKFEEVIGWKRQEIIGLRPEEFFKVIPKEESNEEQAIVKRVLETKEDIKGIIRTYHNSKGDRIKLLVDAHKINNGALVLFNDVKAEQQIANLNLQTEIILNSIAIPAVILDNMNRITAYNKAFTDIMETENLSIIKMSIEELVKIHQGKTVLTDRKYDGNSLVEETYEVIFQDREELLKEALIKASIIYNIDKERIGRVCIVRDITHEKENQQKLINQEKLALLGQMSATIVHETRNFLTTIKGSSQLIQAFSSEEKIKEYAGRINSNTDEVNKIISNLLTISKPSQAVMEEVSINDLIISMKSTLETSTIIKGISVNFNLDYDERYILCDEGQIKQVILNLCKNAVDAMSDNVEPVLTIETGLYKEQEELFIKISDNGIGISQNNLSKIGTPFFTTKKTGTGLGLNACFQIIKNHKGRILVESEVNIGTSFTIIIPCIKYEDLADIS